jgi:homoserine O-acetyltransferase
VIEHDVHIGALQLDGGELLSAVTQRVTIYGSSDAERTVLVCHALTGSSRVAEWWPAIVAAGGLFDPREWRVIGINALGSCYGSSFDPASEVRITVRDMVRAQMRALDTLGIERCEVVIGGSLGGMQAFQWALDAPARVGHAVTIGAHDHHTAMGIALNALQREALALDPKRGLRLARKIAMLTYKSDDLLRRRHDRQPDRRGRPYYDVEGYLDHQADAFERRMDPASYAVLTHAMDSFDVRSVSPHRDQPGVRRPSLTFVGISSDWLFRPQEIRAAARRFASLGYDARYLELSSDHGHDAFLAEPQTLAALLRTHLSQSRCNVVPEYS